MPHARFVFTVSTEQLQDLLRGTSLARQRIEPYIIRLGPHVPALAEAQAATPESADHLINAMAATNDAAIWETVCDFFDRFVARRVGHLRIQYLIDVRTRQTEFSLDCDYLPGNRATGERPNHNQEVMDAYAGMAVGTGDNPHYRPPAPPPPSPGLRRRRTLRGG